MTLYPIASPLSVPVLVGDTLEIIASRVLGDASRWRELADINGLGWPYLDFSGADGRPGPWTVRPGIKVLGALDVLRTPLPIYGGIPPRDPIGTDVPSSGELRQLVGGSANLANALMRRLRTPRGYLPHHPNYGSDLHKYLGKALNISVVLAVRTEIARCLRQDPRVLGITKITADVRGDAIIYDSVVRCPMGPVALADRVTKQTA